MAFIKHIRDKLGKVPKKAEETRGLEVVLLDEVKHEGCPICAATASHDKRYFSWFTIETYHEPAFLEQFEASLGFCRRHGAFLDEQGRLGSQITFVHDYLAGKAYKRLSKYLSGEKRDFNTLFPGLGDCPVCGSFENSTARTVWFFNKMLEEGRVFSDYGHPGILCFPHFQLLALVAAPAVLHRLLPIHTSAMATARNDMEHARPSKIQAGIKGDLCERGLHLSVGLLSGAEDNMYFNRIYHGVSNRDPVADFVASLKDSDGCPVCLEEDLAMSQWINWLNEKISTMDHIDAMLDVLPACREHVLACVHLGRPPVQFAAVYGALKAAQDKALTSSKQLRRLQEKRETPLWQRFKRKSRNTGVTREIDPRKTIIEPVNCPLCARLKVAEKRAIDLLFGLLMERRHRMAFEDGYGLCVKHFIEAAKRAPSHDMRAFLARVESAKLARLQWELDETMRKTAWDTRPESKGSEQTAWHRAISRFSGLPGVSS